MAASCTHQIGACPGPFLLSLTSFRWRGSGGDDPAGQPSLCLLRSPSVASAWSCSSTTRVGNGMSMSAATKAFLIARIIPPVRPDDVAALDAVRGVADHPTGFEQVVAVAIAHVVFGARRGIGGVDGDRARKDVAVGDHDAVAVICSRTGSTTRLGSGSAMPVSARRGSCRPGCRTSIARRPSWS